MENFKRGDKVIYAGSSNDQVSWGGNDDPRECLIEGDIYQVEKVEENSWHTKISLRGITGIFNGVSFEKIHK